MLAVVGTVPDPDFPLVSGEVELRDTEILIRDRRIPVNRGTPALLGAAIRTCLFLGRPLPFAYLVGDVGLGHGSRLLYDHLTQTLGQAAFDVLTFHYLQPDVDWHNKVLFAIEEMKRKPVLIADAGFM